MNRSPGSVWPAIRVAESDAFFFNPGLRWILVHVAIPWADEPWYSTTIRGLRRSPSPNHPRLEWDQRRNTAGGPGKGADGAATGKDRLLGLPIGAGSGATNYGGHRARIRHTDLVHLGSSTSLIPVPATGSSAYFCSTSL